jgi:cation diffusion facilitator CzcD-associated flavoprotein CzcO
MPEALPDCQVVVLGAGPYGLSAAAYLRAAGVDTHVFGRPMSFWQDKMPNGMCLRSNWGASHIADPRGELTLDAYCRENGNEVTRPIPLDRFVDYGQWFQRKAVPDLDQREIRSIEPGLNGFRITLSGGETLTSKRVVIAAGIERFAAVPAEFDRIPSSLASHSSQHKDLSIFSGKSVVVVGAGQSALESAALLMESGASVEVICRRDNLLWVGRHPRLHHLGLVSKMLYSKRDVGPAGISRLVAAPHVLRRFPRWFQDRAAYRAIRPAVAGWLETRIANVPVSFGCQVIAAEVSQDRLRMKITDGTERLVDHALLATGYRVDVTKYSFLAPALIGNLKTFNGFPILKRGLETSVPGLHIVGKPAAWSFGPIVGFVSGAEFASTELVRSIGRSNGNGHRGN